MKNITLETYFGIPTAFSVKGKKGYGKMTIKRELLITIILSTYTFSVNPFLMCNNLTILLLRKIANRRQFFVLS